MTVRVLRSCVIDAPVADVWRLLRDFNSHESWHPAVTESIVEAGEPGELVGAVRGFRLSDGAFLREQLIALSDREMSLTYGLLDAPVPLYGYVARMRLRPVTDRDATFLVWESRFEPPPDDGAALARLVGETIYEEGMTALKARLHRDGPDSQRTGSKRLGFVPPPSRPTRSGRPAGESDTLAIVVDRHGGPEVLVPRRIPVPAPGSGDARVRHRAVGVNMIDLHGRAGGFGLATLPAIPGLEAAGEVLEVGRGVDGIAPGDRVVYAGPPPGAYAQMRTMPADLLCRLPPDIADDDAAAVFLKGLLADALLHDVHRVGPGQRVVVHAAAGGVGLLLCGWAGHLGATVVGVVSSDVKAAAAAAAGCHEVVVTAHRDAAAVVREMTDGRGADVVFDGVGRATFETSIAMLAPRGHLVSFGQASGAIGSRSIDALASQSIRLSRPNLAHFIADGEERRGRAERLFATLRSGAVRPTIDSRLPLAEAAEAHRRLEKRQNVGSIVLLP